MDLLVVGGNFIFLEDRGIGFFYELYGLEVVLDGALEFTSGEEGVDEVALGVVDAVAGEVFFAGGIVV